MINYLNCMSKYCNLFCENKQYNIYSYNFKIYRKLSCKYRQYAVELSYGVTILC